MKKNTFLFSLALYLCLTTSGLYVMAQASRLPYTTDFSTSDGWTTIQVTDTANAWRIGKPDGMNGNALYVSQNGKDTTYSYDYASRVFAKKMLLTGQSNYITVEFDILVGGGYYESDDYVKVYLMDTSIELNPVLGYVNYEYPYYYSCHDYCGAFLGNFGISKYRGHVSMQIPNPNKNDFANLVFLWQNEKHFSASSVFQPGAIISNLSVTETPDSLVVLEMPKGIRFEITGEHSAAISWEPGRDEKRWALKIGGNGNIDTVRANRHVLNGLANRTTYTLYIRALDESYSSNWKSFTFTFNTDPEAWTHGPSDVSETSAVLTGSVSWILNELKPIDFGFSYRKVTEEQWTFSKASVSEEYDMMYELIDTITGLTPFTWYVTGAWAVTKNGDTIHPVSEFAHAFLTMDHDANYTLDTLPYIASFNPQNDYWGLSQGFYNWYAGKPSGNNQVLFISPNGTDTTYMGQRPLVHSIAQHMFKAPEGDYVTVKIAANMDGSNLFGRSKSWLHVSMSTDPAGGFNGYYPYNEAYLSADKGEQTFHFKKPEYLENDTLYLIIVWEDMTDYPYVDYELGDFTAIIRSLSIEATPKETADSLDKLCAPAKITDIYVQSFSSAYVYWTWANNGTFQYKLGENGETRTIINDNYIFLEQLLPDTDYVFYVRKLCDSIWSEWDTAGFSTKGLPEIYLMPAEGISETTAALTAFVEMPFQFNQIKDLGFEYTKTSQADMALEEENWTKLPYEQIDTLHLEYYTYKITASLDNLEKNQYYHTRVYAVSENGKTTYSNLRTIYTQQTAIHEAADEMQLNVFPNPAKDHATLLLDGLKTNAVVTMADINGRIVYKRAIPQGTQLLHIQTTDMASGLYFIKIQTANTAVVKKIAIR